MNLSTNEMDWIMGKIAEGHNKAKEIDYAYMKFEDRIKLHTFPLLNPPFAIALKDSEPINDGSGDHQVEAMMNTREATALEATGLEATALEATALEATALEAVAFVCGELQERRESEEKLTEHFCLDPDQDLHEQLQKWWDEAFMASTLADGTRPEPGDDILTFADLIQYPLRILTSALYDAGLEDPETFATYDNIHKLALELKAYRDARKTEPGICEFWGHWIKIEYANEIEDYKKRGDKPGATKALCRAGVELGDAKKTIDEMWKE